MEEVPIPGARERAELRLRREQMKRYPFCPDHRDKVFGQSCKQCEIERMRYLLRSAYRILTDNTGPSSAEWKAERSRWIDASAELRKGE